MRRLIFLLAIFTKSLNFSGVHFAFLSPTTSFGNLSYLPGAHQNHNMHLMPIAVATGQKEALFTFSSLHKCGIISSAALLTGGGKNRSARIGLFM